MNAKQYSEALVRKDKRIAALESSLRDKTQAIKDFKRWRAEDRRRAEIAEAELAKRDGIVEAAKDVCWFDFSSDDHF